MSFDCDTCPYWDTCGGDVYDCPLMFGDGHPYDFGNN